SANDVDLVLVAVDEGGGGPVARGDDVGRSDEEAVGGDDDRRARTAVAAGAATDAEAGHGGEDLVRDRGDDGRVSVESLLFRDGVGHGGLTRLPSNRNLNTGRSLNLAEAAVKGAPAGTRGSGDRITDRPPEALGGGHPVPKLDHPLPQLLLRFEWRVDLFPL